MCYVREVMTFSKRKLKENIFETTEFVTIVINISNDESQLGKLILFLVERIVNKKKYSNHTGLIFLLFLLEISLRERSNPPCKYQLCVVNVSLFAWFPASFAMKSSYIMAEYTLGRLNAKEFRCHFLVSLKYWLDCANAL